MHQLIILPIIPSWTDESGAIYPVLLQDEQSLVLVDCGYVGFLPVLEAALAAHGFSCADLTHVFITHHDHDHVGTLAALKKNNPRIQIVANAAEADYISGKKPALRLTQARKLQETLPPEQAAAGQAFIDLLCSVEPAVVDLIVQGGDLLPWCGGCEVLATPGHTLGHISLYARVIDTLITGDAAVLENGVLMLANPDYAEDLSLAQQSLEKIRAFGAKSVVCYHGGVFSKD